MRLAGLLMFCAGWAVGTAANVFYVSPFGSDAVCDGSSPIASNSGSLGSCAFATLYKAQNATRGNRCTVDPCTVYVRSGTYAMLTTLAMVNADAGVSWKKYPGDTEPAVLSGGIAIPNSGWSLVPASRNTPAMWSADLPARFDASRRLTQLFANGLRRPRARMPNIAVPATLEAHYSDNVTFHWRAPLTPCPVWGPCDANNTYGFIYDNATSPQLDAASSWPDLKDAWLLSFAAWTGEWRQIASVDNVTKIVKLATPVSMPIGMFGGKGSISGGRFVIDNVRAALDAPGEWWADVYARKLFYIPMPGEDANSTQVVLPFTYTLLSIVGTSPANPVRQVSVAGLTLQFIGDAFAARNVGSGSTTNAVTISNAAGCSLLNLTIFGGGGGAVQVLHGISDLLIDGLTIEDIGANGITMARYPPDSVNVTISNNLIHNAGHTYLYAPCPIAAGGARSIVVTHNEVYDVPWAGMCGGGQVGVAWPAPDSPVATAPPAATFSFNHIHHYGQGVLSDFGGVYVFPPENCFLPSGTPPTTTTCFVRLLLSNNLIEDSRHYATGCEYATLQLIQRREWGSLMPVTPIASRASRQAPPAPLPCSMAPQLLVFTSSL